MSVYVREVKEAQILRWAGESRQYLQMASVMLCQVTKHFGVGGREKKGL